MISKRYQQLVQTSSRKKLPANKDILNDIYHISNQTRNIISIKIYKTIKNNRNNIKITTHTCYIIAPSTFLYHLFMSLSLFWT